MSCKCPTCKLRITDENTHEINEPVKSMYENASSIVWAENVLCAAVGIL